jgi:hypothetical protein
MKALRSLCVVLFLMLLCAAISTASTPASTETDTQPTKVNGPMPVPICPPEDGWCSTIPEPAPKSQLVNGPMPVPICPPEDGWCSTIPEPAPKQHLAN